jgi:hypothetical protein
VFAAYGLYKIAKRIKAVKKLDSRDSPLLKFYFTEAENEPQAGIKVRLLGLNPLLHQITSAVSPSAQRLSHSAAAHRC